MRLLCPSAAAGAHVSCCPGLHSFTARASNLAVPRTRANVCGWRMEGESRRGFDLIGGRDWDLLSLRQFRREARLRYASLNQSEPLRILLFALLTVFSASASALAEALDSSLSDPEKATSLVVSVASFLLFLRERGRRTAQLVRFDRESMASDLSAAFEDPLTGSRKSLKLRDLREKLRVLVVYGDAETLKAVLKEAAVYRRRLLQSQVALVAASSDGSSRKDWEVPKSARGGWLWEATEKQAERDGRQRRLADLNCRASSGGGAWFALNKKGRSRASGLGAPRFDELLGSRLPPTELSEQDAPFFTELDESVAAAQGRFYDVSLPQGGNEVTSEQALTNGKLEEMRALFSEELSEDVSEFVNLGGRLDPWDSQLREGSRPQGMKISSRDVTVADDGLEAWTTCLEQPAGGFGTLLATQRWKRKESGGADAQWTLVAHRTIPFSLNAGAMAILRCDCRGCVAGLRTLDKQGPLDMPNPASD
ncbi:hypothetical protein GUITHDRAFT_106687 [Guillardia theta CCMP2712]|uniref:Uncharacterized protein n=1 Tax=Guillardia theta (strain CCMP2712) TaxID=905079 RepID=L1JGP7_GUITC|nr:hypothetical protein GUITHDRAFT_106687 [Guillardia theta CCMP2712]EKX47698.1 hypothetical protein GUITHDRAFT_106687 [Guillardia theta CCMP2712]|eukprot:XP_005834678.1 hypothetical protein GUITHDRAFT_106687 [Guillardia theta CCMP2712]